MRFANLFRASRPSTLAKPRSLRYSRFVEQLEPRLLLSALDGSEIDGLPSDMTVSLYTTIGDQSPSNSEAWDMNVGGHTLSATYGQVLTQKITYKEGESYPISVVHTSTNRTDGPDYDYRAWIDSSANPGWTNGQTRASGANYFVTDPDGLLQKDYYGGSTDPTVGKTATLNIPGFDMNIDADNTQGFNAPSNDPAEESIENNLDAGKVIWADNGDLNGNGIIDENENGVMGDYFVPVTLSLSQNIADANPSSITINFSFDTSVFALWTKDGTAIRTAADKVQTGQELTASSLGLSPGGTIILYLEALKAYNSVNAKPITANVTVTGGTWSGKLTDTVRAVAVSADKVTATINGQSQSTKDDSLTITADNVFSIPFSANHTMDFSLSGFSPATDRTKSLLHWTVARNFQDAVTSDNPDLTVDPADSNTAHVQLDGVGSFNVIPYLDSNSNGKFDLGEQLRAFHLAIVYVDVQNTNGTDGATQFRVIQDQSNPTNPQYLWALATGASVPNGGLGTVNLSATIQYIGGGQDKTIGVLTSNHQLKIHSGWVGNIYSSSTFVDYGGGHSESQNILDNASFPMLDILGNAVPNGGGSVFRASNHETNNGTSTSLVTAFDAPPIPFQNRHDFGDGAGAIHALTIDGERSFKDFLTTYSDDFNQSYSSFVNVAWSVNIHLTFDQTVTDYVDNKQNPSTFPAPTISSDSTGAPPDVVAASMVNGTIMTPFQKIKFVYN